MAKELAWKASTAERPRGFESRVLRQTKAFRNFSEGLFNLHRLTLIMQVYKLGLAVRVSLPANMLICARLCTLKSRIKNELKESEACGPDSSPEIAA